MNTSNEADTGGRALQVSLLNDRVRDTCTVVGCPTPHAAGEGPSYLGCACRLSASRSVAASPSCWPRIGPWTPGPASSTSYLCRCSRHGRWHLNEDALQESVQIRCGASCLEAAKGSSEHPMQFPSVASTAGSGAESSGRSAGGGSLGRQPESSCSSFA